ncbi:hypothetical protein AMS56_25085 [Burkholderia pseudomallei]|nr:hypothetical protein AMS56_25085 [Burkholderia pseudomallei]
MMMTKEMREALQLARHLIETEDYKYICLALKWVGDYYPRLFDACQELLVYIRSQLGSFTLDQWQHRAGFSTRSQTQTRLDRLAWID